MAGKKGIMNLKELKRKISALSFEEFFRFQAWFEKVEAARQRKQKAALGKIQQGDKEFQAGKTRIVSSLAEL